MKKVYKFVAARDARARLLGLSFRLGAWLRFRFDIYRTPCKETKALGPNRASKRWRPWLGLSNVAPNGIRLYRRLLNGET